MSRVAGWVNWIAAAAIMAMMFLTTADVIMRYFRHPISGAYEIVGFLGSIAVGLALAATSVQRGHVAVSIVFQRFSTKTQRLVESINSAVAAMFFALLAWQLIALAGELKRAGEVSLTLQMPFYPFVYGIAAGSALLALVLVSDFLASLARLGGK